MNGRLLLRFLKRTNFTVFSPRCLITLLELKDQLTFQAKKKKKENKIIKRMILWWMR